MFKQYVKGVLQYTLMKHELFCFVELTQLVRSHLYDLSLFYVRIAWLISLSTNFRHPWGHSQFQNMDAFLQTTRFKTC